MRVTIASLVILVTCFGSSVCSKNTKSGYTIRLTLSDYSNPHQVLAETGEQCDTGVNNICDPFFEVKFGSHPNTFNWANESRVFQNAVNLTGDFFTAEFQIDQEVTDSLYVAITVRDYSPMDHEDRIIARPTVELSRMLPSIAGHRNAVKRRFNWTPDNHYVSFTLTAEINCWPSQYGRRCSTVCHGNPVYPIWEAGDAARSVEITGCRTSDVSISGLGTSANNEASHALTMVKSNYFIVTATLGGVGALALVIFGVVCINRRQRLAKRQRRMYEIRRVSQQNSMSTAAGQQSSYDASISMPYRLDSFKNPVYTPLQLQQLQLQQLQQHQQPVALQTHQRQVTRGGANSTTHDSSIEEVYEEVEEPQVPALPPRQSVNAAAR